MQKVKAFLLRRDVLCAFAIVVLGVTLGLALPKNEEVSSKYTLRTSIILPLLHNIHLRISVRVQIRMLALANSCADSPVVLCVYSFMDLIDTCLPA
jgi:predicted secreted protein